MAGREPFNVTGKTPSGVTTAPHSPWHSPVPYLFGGLAAMLGLIAFALLILACSYWKLSGYLESGEGERDLEAGEGKGDENQKGGGGTTVMEQKFLVIMAGEVQPTFLATPISSTGNRYSSFGEHSENSCCGEKSEKFEQGEKQQQQEIDVHVDDQVQTQQSSSQTQGTQNH